MRFVFRGKMGARSGHDQAASWSKYVFKRRIDEALVGETAADVLG
jgi:hypothetical protein